FVADSIHFPDSLKYTTLVNKRTVFGGGGIMPDYFVPIDTTSATMFHVNLNAKGVINRLAVSDADVKRHELKSKYHDVRSFNNNFHITEEMIARLKQITAEESVEWDEEQFSTTRELSLLQLKALMARDLYNT